MLDKGKTEQQLRWFEELGIDIYKNTYQQCVDELIEIAILHKETEDERFVSELLFKLRYPTN
jgi:hypothetical protein